MNKRGTRGENSICKKKRQRKSDAVAVAAAAAQSSTESVSRNVSGVSGSAVTSFFSFAYQRRCRLRSLVATKERASRQSPAHVNFTRRSTFIFFSSFTFRMARRRLSLHFSISPILVHRHHLIHLVDVAGVVADSCCCYVMRPPFNRIN